VARLASALLMLGVGAGVYSYRARQSSPTVTAPAKGLRVPAGEASPPTAGDLSDVENPLGPAVPSPKIPHRLPTFSLPDRNGKLTAISAWADKSLIINFWATWCAPCRREIPLLESLEHEWRGRGVEVVGIAVDRADSVRAFADELKIGYPLLVGEQSALDVAAALGFESPVFPFTVFTDRRGDVVTLFVGELHPAQASLILTVVDELNRDRLPLSEARRNISDRLNALAPDPAG
jgi:thiol-disulfide isomerase/thioredoxin